MRGPGWTVESTIGLVFMLGALLAAGAGLIVYTTVNDGTQQRIVQQVETTGDVKRLCIEARTGECIDAMSCELVDPLAGGVSK